MSESSGTVTPAPVVPSPRAAVLAAWEHAAVAAGVVAALFLLQGRLNVNLADEGFLWYGVERTAHGAVPMRDFYSYDPGRYYFAATFLRIFGPGIVMLRIANAVFQVLGLWCGLQVAARAVRTRLGLALVAVLLALWMYPRHKLYEPSLAMAAAWVGTRLLERPSRARHFTAGAFVGLAAFFGKNHALYAACAFAVLLAVRWLRGIAWQRQPALLELDAPRPLALPHLDAPRPLALPHLDAPRPLALPHLDAPRPLALREVGALAAGGVVGGLPLVGMLVAVPGFAAAYVLVLRTFAAAGATNLALPFPWPWHVAVSPGPWPEKTLLVAAGVGLLLLPIVYLPAFVRRLRGGGGDLAAQAAPLATSAVGLFYMHHAYARTDSFHLAQAIHPALLVLVLAAGAASTRIVKSVVAAGLAVFTVCGAVPEMPLVQRWAASSPGDRYVDATVGVDRLSVPARTANLLAGARTAIGRPPCAVVAALPHLPGLYPALGLVAPVWDIYPIWPAAGARDRRMRDELEHNHADCILRDEYAGEASFKEAYPETAAWIDRAYAPVPTPELPQKLGLLRRVEETRPAS